MTQQTLLFKHASDESGTIITKEYDLGIALGEFSTFARIDGDLKFASLWNNKERKWVLTFLPIPNKRVIQGHLLITDSNNPKCFDTIFVAINQFNGIWPESMEVERRSYTDCCDNGTIIPTALEDITIYTDKWVSEVQAFVYNDEFTLSVSQPISGSTKLSVTAKTCYDIYDCPIYICGLDYKGNILEQKTIYLSFFHENADDEECILTVTPSQVIIPYNDYKSNSNAIFSITAFSQYPNSALKIDTSDGSFTNTIPMNEDAIYTDAFKFPLSAITINSGDTQNVIKTINYSLRSTAPNSCSISASTNVIVLPYQNVDTELKVYYGQVMLSNNIQVNFTADTDNVSDTLLYLKASETHNFTVESSSSWTIYDYDSSKFYCVKEANNVLAIQLVDFEQTNPSEPLEIVLRNNDDKYFTFLCTVASGLVKTDTYDLWWVVENSSGSTTSATTISANTYYQMDKKPVGILHSEYNLVIEGDNRYYGELVYSSSPNILYDVEQYQSHSGSMSTWVKLKSYDKITQHSDSNDIRVFLYDKPDTPEIGDILFTTDKTFTQETNCYIDFYQVVDGTAVARLNITHPKVVQYKIYTDQEGEINISFKHKSINPVQRGVRD